MNGSIYSKNMPMQGLETMTSQGTMTSMTAKKLSLVLLAVCAWSAPSSASQIIEGRVVSIADGDTLTVLDSSNRQHRVRLAEIDAPEVGHGKESPAQPYGERSRQSLGDLCFRSAASVRIVDIDHYGRIVGRVTCNGVDANLEQVRRGMAWAYKRYVRDPAIVAAERSASASGKGLWASPSPTPPWEWRIATR